MTASEKYSLTFLGHYTKDTIVSGAGTRVVNGGAFYYGASVAARLGVRTAAVTRLAEEDFGVVDALKELGVTVFAPKNVEEEIVDIVTCLSVVQHCSKDEVEVIFKDAAKALKDGGTCYVNGVDTGFDNDAAEKSFLRRRSRFSYSPQEIEALAKKNKLTVSKKMVYRLGRMNVWIFRLKK